MGDTFSFRSFLSGGNTCTIGGSNHPSTSVMQQQQQQNQHQQQHQQQQQMLQQQHLQYQQHQREEMTTLNVNIGNECKTFTVPKGTTFRDLSSTIKDTFGLNSKVTLNIKCENKDGDMFNLASDCHLRKAYRSNGGDAQLRLVVKEVQPCGFSNSIFSWFDRNICTANTNINTNSTNTSTTNIGNNSGSNGNVSNHNHINHHHSGYNGLSGLGSSGVEVQSNFVNSGTSSSVASIAAPSPGFLNRKETVLLDSNLNIKEQHAHPHAQQKSTLPTIPSIRSFPTNHTTLLPSNTHHMGGHHHHHHPHHHHLGKSIYGLASNFSTLSVSSPFSTCSSSIAKSPENSAPINIPPINTSNPNSPSNNTFGSICSKKQTSPSSTPNIRTSTTIPTISSLTPHFPSANQPKVLPHLFPINPMKYYLNQQQQQQQTSQGSQLNSSSENKPTTTTTTAPPATQPLSTMNRNESFEFMQFDNDTDSQVSSGIEDDEMDSINTSVPSTARTCSTPIKTPAPSMCGIPCPPSISASNPNCKEVQEFIFEVTKFFTSLRMTTDVEEQRNLKKTICSTIQSKLATMPWILGVFPQLKQFASDQCPTISVPPNTPPPSPSHQSPLYDMTQKSQVSIFEVPGDLSIDTLNSHLQLQNKIESLMIVKDNNEPHHPSSKSSKSTMPSTSMLAPKLPYTTRKIEGPTIHKGFSCSLCAQSPIVGNLYYCATCTSFNFCDHCKIQKHPSCPNGQHHSIITVTKSMKSCNMPPVSPPSIPRRGCPYGRKKARCLFNLKFVSDVTIPFGSEASPGQQIMKTWRIQNSGSQLPKDCLLVRVCGNVRLSQAITMPLPPMSCNEIINVSVPLLIPDIPSKIDEYLVGEFWRVCTSDGFYFGDQLWISLVIRRKK